MPILIEDTRQQADKHLIKHEFWAQNGQTIKRSKLLVGDYMFIGGTWSIDTKKNILELASDVVQQHKRFKAELILAQECKIKLFILVENSDGVTSLGDLVTWKNPRAYFNKLAGKRPPINGVRLAKACKTMQTKYDTNFVFCRPEDAGRKILEILNFEFNRVAKNE